jgi:hypothetical protein
MEISEQFPSAFGEAEFFEQTKIQRACVRTIPVRVRDRASGTRGSVSGVNSHSLQLLSVWSSTQALCTPRRIGSYRIREHDLGSKPEGSVGC